MDPMEREQNQISTRVDRWVAEIGTGRQAVIPLLHAVQKQYRYLPETALRRICDITEITPADIAGVSTFYDQFRHEPIGEHLIHVCTGTACHVKGADLVREAFLRELRIPENCDTDPQGQFTVQEVACLGCCTLAPVVQIDGMTFGHVKADGIANVLSEFLSRKDEPAPSMDAGEHRENEHGEIRVGLGSCCIASGSAKIQQALERTLEQVGVQPYVKRVGCVGMCHRTPLLEVQMPGEEPVLYDHVNPGDVPRIVSNHFQPASPYKRLVASLQRSVEGLLVGQAGDAPQIFPTSVRDPQVETFLGRQKRIVTEACGDMDPLDMDEYRAREGFQALLRCLSKLSPDEVVGQVVSSGLRGRGGAGFPTGRKWQIVRDVQDETKYVICNGDEGDPGAFMDRMILESYPFRVIEGMAIAAYAVGASQGFLYIRAEYPLAVQRVQAAIDRCRAAGLLGENILNSGFSLSLEIKEGAGAFVCGEETALLASIEGKRGMPSFRPPYPAEKGLWNHATLVNNCETLATIPWIVRNGSEAFAQFGTEKSRGTKVFSLAGKVARGGLIEVPMGVSISEIVEEIGGGIEGGKRFKAVQVGGPSGGCVPADKGHIKIDYEDLAQVGAMMGSGGLLVMDESDCMVDIARYFLSFTYDQSCGKCTACRIGTHHMLEILTRLCAGQGKPQDLEKLEEIAEITQTRSLCGLGKTAPNPVLTTLKYFREEYEAHLNGICPAKRCKGLVSYSVTSNCIGCTLCAQKCPTGAIPIDPYRQHQIIQETCTRCDICRQICPNEAIIAA
jgi:NADH-quinone oxidoreductase subunit F